jgi:UDP-N-acetylglucosamine 2-epimerase (non-hydrolysing)/GDP/UDP-N,N'-diacetylbacillosamine 2-epimerase (hydrolysing)
MGDDLVRRVVYLTGTRADYGLFYQTLRRIEEHPDLDLRLVVTAMHLAPEFGYTVRLIEKDGFHIAAQVETLLAGDSGGSMGRAIGLGILGLTQALESLQPDVLILLGDRGEMLAGAIAAAHLNITIAHVHGGEVSGTIDDSVRHAITKFAHIHFPSTQENGERIVKMGEDPKRVHVVGAPGLDYLRLVKPMERRELASDLDLDLSKPLLLMTQHPVTTEEEAAAEQMRITLEAVKAVGVQTVITYPNADGGGRAMIQVLKAYEALPFVRIWKSLEQRRYVSLLRYARAMLGNSSSGIIEAPYFGLPVVSIGTRQQGRQRAENVLDVPHDRDAIEQAIRIALTDETFIQQARHCTNPYGDGHAGERISKVLAQVPLDREFLQKRLAY